MTFFSSESRRVILNKKHFSLFTGVFSPHLFPALRHFGSCYCEKQTDVSFYVFVLLFIINFVIRLSKFTAEPLTCGMWFHNHFDNVMTQFTIKRGQAHKILCISAAKAGAS